MKFLIFPVLIAALTAAAAAQTAAGTQLDAYVGGRVVAHRADGVTSYTYDWPGIYFEGRFTGDAVDVKVDDDQDNLYLYIDGVHKLTLTRPGRATVSLKALGAGAHTVRLEKASETQSATGSFDGFYVAGAADALPAPRYDRGIEFIGDSYTVGYGDTARGQTCTVADVRDTTDTSLAFAPATAKHFDAAYRIIADSGHGVVRNYANIDPGNTMPVLYHYALLDKSVPAQDEGWMPDVVVIGLGTNDFSTALGPDEPWKTRDDLKADFVRTYVAFVTELRAKWPAAHIILMASTIYNGEIIDAVNAVGDALKTGGLSDFEIIAFSNLDYQACDGHPSLNDEKILSQLLIDRISTLPKFTGFGDVKPADTGAPHL
jgi:lysophospholipase L1-like esterase